MSELEAILKPVTAGFARLLTKGESFIDELADLELLLKEHRTHNRIQQDAARVCAELMMLMRTIEATGVEPAYLPREVEDHEIALQEPVWEGRVDADEE